MSESLETTTGSSLRLTSWLEAGFYITGKAHFVFAAAVLADCIFADKILEGLQKRKKSNDNKGCYKARNANKPFGSRHFLGRQSVEICKGIWVNGKNDLGHLGQTCTFVYIESQWHSNKFNLLHLRSTQLLVH
jgi:hypothetical protein